MSHLKVMDTTTRLVLIRHGHSIAQLEGRMALSHDTCKGLSELGRQQVASLCQRLAETGELGEIDAVYTSLSTRTIETCEQLAAVLPSTYQSECDWCESHPGESEGLLWEDIEVRYPRRAGKADPFERRIPGSETWVEVYARVGKRLNRLPLEHPGQQVVVLTHGGVVGASFVALGDIPVGKATAFIAETRNTSITEWRHSEGEWRLVRFNDAAHLV